MFSCMDRQNQTMARLAVSSEIQKSKLHTSNYKHGNQERLTSKLFHREIDHRENDSSVSA